MKITFVGTSHGVPAADRFCSCIMLESGGSVYFIDAGASLVDALLRYGKDVNSLKAVFTTHVHSDHTMGIPLLADLMNWSFTSSSADFYITEQKLIDGLKAVMLSVSTGMVHEGVIHEDRIRFKIPSAGLVYEDENIKVEYIPTKHINCSYAILVTEGEKKVLFSGDLSLGLKGNDIPQQIEQPLDGFVCEMAHFKMPVLAPYLNKCKAKKVFFTHVFPSTNFDDIELAKKDYSFDICAPSDGDVFEI